MSDLGKFIREVTFVLGDEMGDFGFTPQMAYAHVTNHIGRVIERFTVFSQDHNTSPSSKSWERAVRETAWSVMFAVVSTMQKKEKFQ